MSLCYGSFFYFLISAELVCISKSSQSDIETEDLKREQMELESMSETE